MPRAPEPSQRPGLSATREQVERRWWAESRRLEVKTVTPDAVELFRGGDVIVLVERSKRSDLMPTAAPRLCGRCHQPTRGRCPRCHPLAQAATDRHRGNSAQRGYDNRWRKHVRLPFLRAHPICVLCGGLANVPDHWPETRRSLITRGVPDPDAWHRLRPLCDNCHNRHGAR